MSVKTEQTPPAADAGRKAKIKDAILSPCGTWRYRLDRVVADEGIVFAYFGVNPSTADADAEDQTTKKWWGFASRNGGRKYIAGNPFAYRTTDVRGLATAADPVGPPGPKNNSRNPSDYLRH